jgi:hypothetical protein
LQQNEFLNQVTQRQALSYAEQADQAQMAAALGVGTSEGAAIVGATGATGAA